MAAEFKNLIIKLEELDQRGIQVISSADLKSMLGTCSPSVVTDAVKTLLSERVLQRVARGVFVNLQAQSRKSYLIEEIACVLRKGYFNYVSLESILSEFGVISQIMISRITVMTTGRKGTFSTPYGIIEFTHSARKIESLVARTLHIEGRPLRIATKRAGAADLVRVGRNTNMIDWEELADDGFYPDA
ncbi:type IV toxin-antitoxin system AbiEi family antitoxin [Massilia sp. CMS3.1]|uniref:type IV toxin-antitoxin system AbiEi family antitoxin n=1 Tax=Massilia sp. CMS3.1 TaxID=3373083 RepID=UPI003EE6E7AA